MKEFLNPSRQNIISHLGTFGVLAGTAGLIVPYWFYKYNSSYSKTNSKNVSGYLLVLGHKSESDKASPCMISRTDTARDLLKSHTFDKVILTGGGTGVSEASLMKSLLGDGAFLLEEKSTTTYENFLFSGDMIMKNSHVVIVSSAYHARRIEVMAPLFFKSFEVIKAPSPGRGLFCHSSEALWSGWLEVFLKIKALISASPANRF